MDTVVMALMAGACALVMGVVGARHTHGAHQVGAGRCQRVGGARGGMGQWGIKGERAVIGEGREIWDTFR